MTDINTDIDIDDSNDDDNDELDRQLFLSFPFKRKQRICFVNFFCIEPKHRNRMLRFFSRRKSKHRIDGSDYTRSKDGESLSRKNQKYRPNKNVIVCKIILLDGNDLSIDVPVSPSAGV